MSDATEHIRHLLAPILDSMGLTLWDLEFKKEGPKWLLRIYIDREGSGVTIDDCALVSRDLATILDVEDTITHAYTLEVSSPGLDRTLRTEDHFLRSLGKHLKLKTYLPVNGEKVFTGTLKDFAEGKVIIETDMGTLMEFPIESIAKAQLTVVI